MHQLGIRRLQKSFKCFLYLSNAAANVYVCVSYILLFPYFMTFLICYYTDDGKLNREEFADFPLFGKFYTCFRCTQTQNPLPSNLCIIIIHLAYNLNGKMHCKIQCVRQCRYWYECYLLSSTSMYFAVLV